MVEAQFANVVYYSLCVVSNRVPQFKKDNDADRRKKLSAKITTTYNRVPVIVEKAHARAPDIAKSKFLAPLDMSVGNFVSELRKHIAGGRGANESIFLFTADSRMPPSSTLMSQVWDQHKDAEDSFLYLFYATENVFG